MNQIGRARRFTPLLRWPGRSTSRGGLSKMNSDSIGKAVAAACETGGSR
jgi:hypothetical protein